MSTHVKKDDLKNASEQDICKYISGNIMDFRTLRTELVQLSDCLIDTVCVDYAMKIMSFINMYAALQTADKEEEDIAGQAYERTDGTTIGSNMQTLQQEIGTISQIIDILRTLYTNPLSNPTVLGSLKLNNKAFTIASEVLGIPIQSMNVTGIDPEFLRNILNNGLQSVLDSSMEEVDGYTPRYNQDAIRNLMSTLAAYAHFLKSAVDECVNTGIRREDNQKQKDYRMENEITKTIHGIFSYNIYDSASIPGNSPKTKLLLINNMIAYLDVCDKIFDAVHVENQNTFDEIFSDNNDGFSTDTINTNVDISNLIDKFRELCHIADAVNRIYRVRTISNVQVKKNTQYKIRGLNSDYVAFKSTGGAEEPIAFTDRLMSAGIISNKIVYAIYTVVRSICRDSEYSHGVYGGGEKDKKNSSYITLGKQIVDTLFSSVAGPQRISASKFADNILMSEVIFNDNIKARIKTNDSNEYMSVVNTQFENQIERLLSAVLVGIRKIAGLSQNMKEISDRELYPKRYVCEDLVRLLTTNSSNIKEIGGKMILFNLELIPKEIRREICGDKPESELLANNSITELKGIFGIVKEPLIHYDPDNRTLFYIPVGRLLNYVEYDEVSMANFLYTYVKDKGGAGDRGQRSETIRISNSNNVPVIEINYMANSTFAWLYNQAVAIEQYAVVGNKSDRLFRIYSDEQSYGKIYQRKLNKPETKELLSASTIMLSSDDLTAIRNDIMFNENISEAPLVSLHKENRLLKTRPAGSLVYSDKTAADEDKIFLLKGSLAGNDFFLFDKDAVRQNMSNPVTYLGRFACPAGNEKDRLNFNVDAGKGPMKISFETFCLFQRPNHFGKKGKPVGINTLNNNSMYSSRKVLLTILEKYVSSYANYYSSPFALIYVFQKYKREILAEYFYNLKIILDLIIKDELSEFFNKISNDSTLKAIIYNLIISDNPVKGTSENTELTLNGAVIEEVMNVLLFIQKNKKMQMMYRKVSSSSNSVYDKEFLHYEPLLNNRPTPVQIDNILIDSLDFTENNLNYDFITLEDLWGIPIVSSEKTTIEKSYQVFNVVKGVFKPVLSNLNPVKPAEKTYKNTLSNVLRALYFMYSGVKISAPELKGRTDTEQESVGGVKAENSADTITTERKEKFMIGYMIPKTSSLPADAAERTRDFPGFFRGRERVDWFGQIDWAGLGIVTEDGTVDTEWVEGYKEYITKVISHVQLKDFHKESTVGKAMERMQINPEFIAYLYINKLLKRKYDNISVRNTLYFNRLDDSVTGGDNSTPRSESQSIIELYYDELGKGVGRDDWENGVCIADAVLAKLKIKKPQTGYVIRMMGDGADTRSTYKVDITMSVENLRCLSETLRRLWLGAGIISPNALRTLEDGLVDAANTPAKISNLLMNISEKDINIVLAKYGIPTSIDMSDGYIIKNYVNNSTYMPDENITVDLPFAHSDNYRNQTFIRDVCMLNYMFRNSTIDLMRILVSRGEDEFAKRFDETFDKFFVGYENVIKDSDFGFDTDAEGKHHFSKFVEYIQDRVLSNVSHPIEYERVMCNIVDRTFVARDNSSDTTVSQIISDLVADKNLELNTLRQLETQIETVVKRNAFFNSLKNYAPLDLCDLYNNWMTNSLGVLSSQYKVSLPSIERARIDRQKNDKLYEMYLNTGNEAFLDKIDLDSVSFDLLTNSRWDKVNVVVPKYSVRGMVRRNPNLLTSYVGYLHMGAQIYTEFDLEQDISGGNNNISMSGKSKSPLPSFNCAITQKETPGLVDESVAMSDILSRVSWYTEPVLDNRYFTEGSFDVALNIYAYDIIDIWYVYKNLMINNQEKNAEQLNEIMYLNGDSRGAVMDWLIENGIQWRSRLDDGSLEILNPAWDNDEYRDSARVLSAQSLVVIPKAMKSGALKQSYNTLLKAVKIVMGDKVDESVIAAIFNYMASNNLLYGCNVTREQSGSWKIDCGYFNLGEDIDTSARLLMDGYEQFCSDYFTSMFYLQSLSFSISDANLQKQYTDYWHGLPRNIITSIMKQIIKVEKGIHSSVYSKADQYVLPFKSVTVEDITGAK